MLHEWCCFPVLPFLKMKTADSCRLHIILVKVHHVSFHLDMHSKNQQYTYLQIETNNQTAFHYTFMGISSIPHIFPQHSLFCTPNPSYKNNITRHGIKTYPKDTLLSQTATMLFLLAWFQDYKTTTTLTRRVDGTLFSLHLRIFRFACRFASFCC